ncbi:SurA N-terminal domain-containing protein [Maricaulis sp. D1M11]|uniref:SurA N-terminal domain-containing protein n=1 Tax=Maricaulis sp. D1M11 TaxID=3076117 RepID=UPI0039B47E27
MLTQVRSFSKSPFAIVLIGLLVASFALWGVSDIFATRTPAVALVGTEDVSVRDLNEAYENEVRRLMAEQPGFTRRQAQEIGLGDQVLDRLIVQAALQAKANEMGLTVSDDELNAVIRSMPGFENPVTGRFDADSYRQTLAVSRITPQRFEAGLREELTRNQLIVTMLGGIETPAVFNEINYRFENERRALRGLILSPDAADSLADPSDEDLQTLIANSPLARDPFGRPRYTAPEYRAFTLVRFDPANFALDIEIDESLLRDTYDYEVESGAIGTPATRSFEQVTATDEAEARALAARADAGETLTDLAAEASLGLPLEQSEVQAYQIPDEVIAEAVFAAPADEILVVEGSFGGWQVIRITAAVEPSTPSFEEREDELRTQLAEQDAQNAMYSAWSEYENARAQGMSLEEAAFEAGMFVEVFPPVDPLGVDQNDQWTAHYNRLGQPEGLPQEVLSTLFEQIPGFATESLEYGNGSFFALRVDEVIASRPRELDEVREVAEDEWRREQVNTLLTQRLADARARVEAGEDLELVAASSGGRVELAFLTRTETAGLFGRQAVQTGFGLAPGEWTETQADDGVSQILLTVDEIIVVDPTAQPVDQRVAMAQTLEQMLINDLAEQLQSALLEEYGPINIDAELRATALGEAQPSLQ